jgi:hypothetical protein
MLDLNCMNFLSIARLMSFKSVHSRIFDGNKKDWKLSENYSAHRSLVGMKNDQKK